MAKDDLERYRLLMSYHASERQIFIARTQIFTFASAALIAFVSRSLPSFGASASWVDIAASGIGTSLGIGLWIGWHRAINAGNWWINRLRTALLTYEKASLGDTKVFRETKLEEQRGSMETFDRTGLIWEYLITYFFVLWMVLAIWVLIAIVTKSAAYSPELAKQLTIERILIAVIVIILSIVMITFSRTIRSLRDQINAVNQPACQEEASS